MKDIRIVEVDGEKRARFDIEVELVGNRVCVPDLGHLFSSDRPLGKNIPIVARAVEALKAAQEPKFEVGKWYQFNDIATCTPFRVVKVDGSCADIIHLGHTICCIQSRTSRAREDYIEIDPPTPDFMTAEELTRRFKPTGNLLEDTKMALELSIEKWKRSRVWKKLVPGAEHPVDDAETCALCRLFFRKKACCPLAQHARPACGDCCPEYINGNSNDVQPLIDLMERKLAEIEEKLAEPDEITVEGVRYRRVEGKKPSGEGE